MAVKILKVQESVKACHFGPSDGRAQSSHLTAIAANRKTALAKAAFATASAHAPVHEQARCIAVTESIDEFAAANGCEARHFVPTDSDEFIDQILQVLLPSALVWRGFAFF